MNDRSLHLRQVLAIPRQEPVEPTGPPVLVVGSGKGGVGKSVVATLFAAALAERGAKVLLLDGSQNLGHLHVMLGVPTQARLEQVMAGEIEPEALLCRVGENLWLLPADSGAEGLYALGAVDQARLHHRLSNLYDDFSVVVVDAGPGLEAAVRLSTMRGTRLVVVTVPEAAALTDAYALIKLVHGQLPSLPIDVLVNRTETAAEADQAFERLATAATRFLGRPLEYLGGLPECAGLRTAMRRPGAWLTDPTLGSLRLGVEAVVARRLAECGLAPADPIPDGTSR
jgi:flagellar biosynthesis protein FlhG